MNARLDSATWQTSVSDKVMLRTNRSDETTQSTTVPRLIGIVARR